MRFLVQPRNAFEVARVEPECIRGIAAFYEHIVLHNQAPRIEALGIDGRLSVATAEGLTSSWRRITNALSLLD